MLLAWILAKALITESEFKLHDIPGMTRDFYPVGWIASVITRLVNSQERGTFHIGSGQNTIVEELIRYISEQRDLRYTKVVPPPGTTRGTAISEIGAFDLVRSVIGDTYSKYDPIHTYENALSDYIQLTLNTTAT